MLCLYIDSFGCCAIPDVLGGMSVGYNGNTPFIDSNGDMVDVSSLIVTERDGPGYSKVVTKIRTPKVLEVIRTQFGCATMTGMPLEDLPMAGGYSVHWEARLAGPEVILSSSVVWLPAVAQVLVPSVTSVLLRCVHS